MKRYIYSFYFAVMMLGMVLMSGCDDMNSIHEKYYDRGEALYTGIVDSLSIESGNKKAKFRYMLNADPRIKQVVIFYNDYAEYKVIDVVREKPGIIWIENQIIDFPENSYVFYVVTTDGEGHFSMPVEKDVTIYGPKYIATLTNRFILDSNTNDGKSTLTWGNINTSTLLYTTVKYIDTEGVLQEIRVENDIKTTELNGVKAGSKIKVVSTFQPDNAYTTFDAKETIYTLQ